MSAAPTLDIEAIGRQLYLAFLKPSVLAAEWHDRYKWLNRCAGAISGLVEIWPSLPGGAYLPADQRRGMLAEQLCEAALVWVDLEEQGTEANRKRVVKGLPERTAKCLLRMQGVEVTS